MKIKEYVSSLLPSFTKSRLTEDLNIIREELKVNTIPPYTAASKAYATVKFQAADLKRFEEDFKRGVKTKFRGNSLSVIEQTLKRMEENTDVVEKLIANYYADDVMRDAMTFLKVNITQYIETMSFVSRYARRHLLWVMATENHAINGDQEFTAMTPGEVEWLRVQRQNFFTGITILGGERSEKGEIDKSFNDIPDIVISKDNVPVIEKTVGAQKIDPFHFGLIPVWLNPIYHVRMQIAEWQVKRFKAAQKEREIIELRLLQLKQAAQGKKDARLQEQIEYNEGRLQRLNYELQKMEEDYA